MELKIIDEELSLTNKEECEESALKVLSIIKPKWDLSQINFEYFSVGITNKIFATGINEENRVIFRVFGKNTDKIIDRKNEVVAWEKLANVGLAAPLYAKFKNGLVCGYLNGTSLDVDKMKSDEILRKIAHAIGKLHLKVPSKGTPMCFERMRLFKKSFSPHFNDREDMAFYTAHFPKNLDSEIDFLESEILRLNEDVAFCHNDLLVHNIVHNPKDGSINFIDYEYAGSNYVLFDIGNHFCEHAGVEDTPDYTKCLTSNEKAKFIKEYLQCRDGNVELKKLDRMMNRVPLFEAAAHLFWAIWALVQSQNSTIDFDYLRYAAARFEQYKKRFNKYSTRNLANI